MSRLTCDLCAPFKCSHIYPDLISDHITKQYDEHRSRMIDARINSLYTPNFEDLCLSPKNNNKKLLLLRRAK